MDLIFPGPDYCLVANPNPPAREPLRGPRGPAWMTSVTLICHTQKETRLMHCCCKRIGMASLFASLVLWSKREWQVLIENDLLSSYYNALNIQNEPDDMHYFIYFACNVVTHISLWQATPSDLRNKYCYYWLDCCRVVNYSWYLPYRPDSLGPTHGPS